MSYLRLRTTPSPGGQFVVVRLVSGGHSDAPGEYAGTITLPADRFEHLLDCLVFGAAYVTDSGGQRLDVRFGPDDGGPG